MSYFDLTKKIWKKRSEILCVYFVVFTERGVVPYGLLLVHTVTRVDVLSF